MVGGSGQVVGHSEGMVLRFLWDYRGPAVTPCNAADSVVYTCICVCMCVCVCMYSYLAVHNDY